MADRHINDYTVCIVFNSRLESALMVRKGRTAFKGMLNGPGGAVEPDETPYAGALREIQEETGLAQDDLQSLGLVRLVKLGELLVPEDCKVHDGSACRLHYYAGAVKPGHESRIRPAEEPLEWIPADMAMHHRTDTHVFAGHGDLAYFAAAGYRALSALLPVQAAPAEDSERAIAKTLAESIAVARGRLDADFRNQDLYQASQDAAEVSRLAYAAFYMKTAGWNYKRKGDGENGEELESETDAGSRDS